MKPSDKPVNGTSNGLKGTQSKNKYAILEDCDDEGNRKKLNKEQVNEVEYFVKQRMQPTPFETSKWSHEMVKFFKDSWERMIDKGQNKEETEDVMEDLNGNGMMVNEIEGMAEGSNVYATNHGKERTKLWRDLTCQKQIVNDRPWVMLGAFNVTLYAHEHSTGWSSVSQDIQDFKECVSTNKLEDLCSTRFQFTWTKSPKNPMYGILKNLDRVMCNEKFIDEFGLASAIFLPYIISDHSPSMVGIPNGLRKKTRVFRFANFIVDKPEFMSTVAKESKMNVVGFQTFKVVKTMKSIKNPINRLNWKNGNLFDKVILLKDKLKEWQAKIDRDPFNTEFKKEESTILKEYREDVVDENKLMAQKAKIEWMKDGDKCNTPKIKQAAEHVALGCHVIVQNTRYRKRPQKGRF
ncbi:RNA-directed DNA polymerase, eukaryota, reverse transcriptase zinc-binding domain protein [Tanacetum coccineum]